MADLRKLAEAATPGPWRFPSRAVKNVVDIAPPHSFVVVYCKDEEAERRQREADAAFIAAANPQAVIGLLDERDELRAALLNERGEGTGPSEGWARNDFDRRAVGIAWYRPSNADGSPPPAGAMDYAYVLWVYREPTEPEWTWECEHADFSSRNIQGKAPTAREAMRAADTALAGAKS